jgi:hypothetical protein
MSAAKSCKIPFSITVDSVSDLGNLSSIESDDDTTAGTKASLPEPQAAKAMLALDARKIRFVPSNEELLGSFLFEFIFTYPFNLQRIGR